MVLQLIPPDTPDTPGYPRIPPDTTLYIYYDNDDDYCYYY